MITDNPLTDEIDKKHLRTTIELSRLCPPSQTAFSVGAVLVNAARQVVSTGYSREMGADWHAEAVAIHKAREANQLEKGMTIYSSMEPCSIRKSGKSPCCHAIIQNEMKRVVFILREPDTFVHCEGVETLRQAGIVVTHDPELEPELHFEPKLKS